MKKLIVFIALIVVGNMALCQPLNNEWIDYSKTYYKFKVGATGLYRINQSTLANAGLASVSANQFQLFKNGVQVPIYTSIATGTFATTDFIEFWGEINDGKLDKNLYKNTANQHSDKLSLLTDTAAYFLTVNTITTQNLRYNFAENNVATNTLTAEPYFTHSLRFNFKDQVNRGYYDASISEAIYSSTYDMGEFLCTKEININNAYNILLNNLYVATSSTNNATIKLGLFSNGAVFSRNIQFNINNNTLYDTYFQGLTQKVETINNIALSNFNNTGNVATIRTHNIIVPPPQSGQPPIDSSYDRVVASFLEIEYPRLFNFDNKSNFEFTLPASNIGNYLKISNFNNGASTAILYDKTNLKYYVANVSIAGVLQFAIPATTIATNYVLVSRNTSNINIINNADRKNFIDFSLTNNQGNYLIISNKLLTTQSNAVEQYKQYRSSTIGGNYNAKVYDIDELVDQFAFGVKKHPLSVRNFLKYATNNFAIKPNNVFLIGKAVTYDAYRFLQVNNTQSVELQNLVPTYGWPASDAMLVSKDNTEPAPMLPFGRLSAITQDEVLDYLNKVKEYELQTSNTTQTIASKAWMKRVVHVAGADDTNLSRYLTNSLNSWGAIIKDSSFGATITTLSKTSGSSVNTTQNDIAKLFENGIALLTYYGHSAATGLAYNLNNPNDYNNTGKYPVFLVNGCSAGNFFDYDTVRFNIKNSLAEKFVLAKSKGSIAFIATSHFGITSYLDPYSTGFYTSVSKTNYGSTIGENMMGALAQLKIASNNFTDYHGSNHGQQFILHGDPAIKIYTSTKPDFIIEDAQVAINPTFISVLNNSFTFKANMYNIGKATGDSVRVLVTRKYPNGADSIIINKKIESIKYQDSIAITIPVNPITDKGNNSITIAIDNDYKYDELSETNNTITKQFVIFEDALIPIYPYNYSIIHQQNIKLSASTANAFAPLGQYIMELDTTALFNSSFKITKTISSVGGLLQFDPAIIFKDSTVYYWRVAAVPSNGVYHWGNSSFVFLQNATQDGFNQSHFYQHCESDVNNLVADTASRTFLFPIINNTLTIRNAIYPYNLDAFSIAINDAANPRTKGICWRGQNLTFTVYNPSTLNEMYNVPANAPIGLYGSLGSPGGTLGREYDFAFNTTTIAGRKAAMDFMDNIIANGSYVVVRSIILDDPYWPTPTYAIDWKSDDTLYGTGNSLYHRLKNAGFNDIDLFNKKRAFAFVYQKNNIAFTPVSTFSKDSSDVAILKVVVPTKPNEGYVISPKFGPAKKWYNMLWAGIKNDLEDMVNIKLLGVKNNNVVDTLQTFTDLQINNDITNIDAATYPYLKIMMQVKDTTYLTAYQLKYWRLLADVLPEGGLLPINFVFKDTLQKGEPQNIAIAFKNISNTAYSDSLNVKLNITDNNNVTHSLHIAKLKKLLPGDIDTIKTTINTQDFAGTNNFYISINPLNTPQEQTLTNNFVYKKFFVINDNINPVLDVTFDGTHILNGDIVSSKPNIHINLKDESTFMLLNDTSIMNVKLQYHDEVNGTIITMNYKYDNDILKFIPAAANGKNTATVEFNPILLNDGTYELFITAKDKSENATGTQQYRVLFRVNNKPMISNVFNYPNPFTTSTAFVFTLTGSQIPDNLRIQILTVTGKIVKEITKNELGYLHIGNNITDYKWDGTDMYGQALGNGVYLYRVITSLNGKALDKFNASNFNSDAVNTDNYFKAGYGKMYLMR